jgi:hypothetical protein
MIAKTSNATFVRNSGVFRHSVSTTRPASFNTISPSIISPKRYSLRIPVHADRDSGVMATGVPI